MASLPLDEAIELINYANEKEQESRFYKWWLSMHPEFARDKYKSFSEFYEEYKPHKVSYDTRSKDELMDEILNISKRG